jgi:hypothetical protein
MRCLVVASLTSHQSEFRAEAFVNEAFRHCGTDGAVSNVR